MIVAVAGKRSGWQSAANGGRFHVTRFRWGRLCCVLVALLVLASGCGVWMPDGGPVPVDPGRTSIGKALDYLRNTQVTVEQENATGKDYAGNWPQVFFLSDLPAVRVGDVSPFMATFIHHALTLVVDQNAGALGLAPADLANARTMRTATVSLMRRFEAGPDDPAAGAYAFWPYREVSYVALDQLAGLWVLGLFQEPILAGSRAPPNIRFFPPGLAIPPDADDTATIYAVLLDHARIDGPGAPGSPDPSFARYFSDWRDTGQVPRRLNPDWLPPASGAFLTWLAYRSLPTDGAPNDIDLIVNANVLYALGRYHLLNTPGVEEAIALINTVTLQGIHAAHPDQVSDYYPDNLAYHYCISRAYREGGVLGLQPAVERLADELEGAAQTNGQGSVYWDRGDPHLNTAFAVLTLLNAGRDRPTVDGAVAYLVAQQDPAYGNWDEGVFFLARPEGGQTVLWSSPALVTAMAMEALCRHQVAQAAK